METRLNTYTQKDLRRPEPVVIEFIELHVPKIMPLDMELQTEPPVESGTTPVRTHPGDSSTATMLPGCHHNIIHIAYIIH